jgi:hypothetical protein
MMNSAQKALNLAFDLENSFSATSPALSVLDFFHRQCKTHRDGKGRLFGPATAAK